MASRLQLTPLLLSFILLFKAQQKMSLRLQMYQDQVGGNFSGSDWYSNLHAWYMGFNQDELDMMGLVKNEITFDALLHLEVPSEWMTTLMPEIGKFTFSI